RVLQVGAARHDRRGVRARLRRDRINELNRETADVSRRIQQKQADESGDLVVAAPARTQATPQLWARDVEEVTLERAVDIFIRLTRGDAAIGNTRRKRVESGPQTVKLLEAEETRRVQRRCVRTRPRNVVGGKGPIELGRAAEQLQLGRRPTGESSTPQSALVRRTACRRLPRTHAVKSATISGRRR